MERRTEKNPSQNQYFLQIKIEYVLKSQLGPWGKIRNQKNKH